MTTATAATGETRRPQHRARTQREAVDAEHQIDRSSSLLVEAAPSAAAARFGELGFLALVGVAQIGWLAAAAYGLTRLI